MSEKFWKIQIIIILLLFFCIHGWGEETPDKNQGSSCEDCTLKIGDPSMIKAVFIATGPSFDLKKVSERKLVVFYSTEETNKESPENGDWTDIFINGIIEYDQGLSIKTEWQNSGINNCVNYATLCPGSYSYDKNGVRIDYPGFEDPEYRIHCCGNSPWTPIYRKPDSDSRSGG